MSNWGKGVLNNIIGWGQGGNNDISWGNIYKLSNSGQTQILNFLLTNYPNAGAAYSLRKINYNTTNVVRIRRSSDNSESNFTATQITDGTLLTFCGSGSGFVATWYDQSGNNAHAIQATAVNQPSLIVSGVLNLENGKPAIVFNGTTNFLSFNGEVLNKGSFLAFTVAKNLRTSDSSRIFDQSNINGGAVLSSNGNQAIFAITSAGNIVVTRNSVILTQSLRTSQALSGNTKIRQNGGLEMNNTTTFTMSGNTGVDLVIGNNSPPSATNAFQGNMQEIIIYTTNNNVNIAEIETQINNNYLIY